MSATIFKKEELRESTLRSIGHRKSAFGVFGCCVLDPVQRGMQPEFPLAKRDDSVHQDEIDAGFAPKKWR